MSSLAGIYRFDGQPAEQALLERMLAAADYRAPDGFATWTDGPVGLAYGRCDTTAEALAETQPLTDETGTLCLIFDGRIDNREELKRALAGQKRGLRSDTDAELVLQSYIVWGTDCAIQLLGDFAFVVWDARDRRLFAARDILGFRPYYYYLDKSRFLFGSALRQLLDVPGVPREPNEGMIAEILCDWITSREETLFRGLYRLPPAHCLTVQNGQLSRWRYWDPNPADIRYRTDAEYAEHFNALFREAVRCRLRSHRPVAIHISGGLDSSSVAVVASELAREGLAPNPGMMTFSVVFPGLRCDESAYIRDVEAVTGLPAHQICWEETPPDWYRDAVCRFADLPDYPGSSMMNGVHAEIRAQGIRAVLSGAGGDDWLEGSGRYPAELLASGQWGALLRLFRADARQEGWKYALYQLWRGGLLPLIPEPLRRPFKLRNRRRSIQYFLPREFAERTQIVARILDHRPPRRFRRFTQQELYEGLYDGRQTYGDELDERYYAWFEQEGRHPFHDRRIIEFALAIPETQRGRGSITKYVLRQAMRGRLPESVRQRATKAEFSAAYVRAMQLLGGEPFFALPALAALKWVQPAAVQERYRTLLRDYEETGSARYAASLWQILGLELWCRELFTLEGE